MPRKSSTVANGLIQAVILKKCDRTGHRPESNKQCANGTCQHTCEPGQVEACAHKWTVRYSVSSRQREQSFATKPEAEKYQLELSAGKQAQGAMYTDPKAGEKAFLPLCDDYIGEIAKAGERSKGTYRMAFRNPAVRELLKGKSVVQVARMDSEVTHLLNTTIGGYSRTYRGAVRRVIIGTLDYCVRKDFIARHQLAGIELGPRVVTAEQYEEEAKGKTLVRLDDETVRMLADGMTVTGRDKIGRRTTRKRAGLGIAVWLQRTMGLRIREALGVRKSDFIEREDGTRYLHLCWQATEDGHGLEPLKHRQAGDFRDVPVPAVVWAMVQALPDGPLCPGQRTPYMPYDTARNRFERITADLGITGAHTHSLRHQFATEALEADPRELANISKVIGHKDAATTLRFYIPASGDAEARVGALMDARWPAAPAPAPAAPARRTAAGRPALKAVA